MALSVNLKMGKNVSVRLGIVGPNLHLYIGVIKVVQVELSLFTQDMWQVPIIHT